MKKLFTIVVLLACFIGANAETKTDYSVDYSKYTGFPWFVMGYCPEWVDGIMTDLGGLYEYATEENEFSTGETTTTNNGTVYYRLEKQPGDDGNIGLWHQYFIGDGFSTESDQDYTVTVLVKSTKEVTCNLQFGNWGNFVEQNVTIPESSDFEEVVWEVKGCKQNGGSFMVIQPNSDAVIEWKSLTVTHEAGEEQPITWINMIKNGDASAEWANPDAYVADGAYQGEGAEEICAYSKEYGYNDNNPHAAFIKDGAFYTTTAIVDDQVTGDAVQWQNQFWINFPRALKEGEALKLTFKYKASENASASAQGHGVPGAYMNNLTSLDFTEEWQTYTNESFSPGAGQHSLAFNLGVNGQDQKEITFYFDDITLEYMELEEGYFAAAINTDNAEAKYDFTNSIKFEYSDADAAYVAVVGGESEDEWVNQVMIATARGNDKGFKANTIKVSGTIVNDPDVWLPYEAAAQSKIALPVRGQWQISISEATDDESSQINFIKLVGDPDLEPVDIITNESELVTNATDKNGAADWNNQFWIMANRAFLGTEQTVLEFQYCIESDDEVEAKVDLQAHKTPGSYVGNNGSLTFTNQWQDYKEDFNPGADVQSMAFNMACEEIGYKYKIRNVKWYLKDEALNADDQTYENFINAEGQENFYVKVDGGTTYRYDQQPEGVDGDANGDGGVDVGDIDTVIEHIGGEYDEKVDVNNDGDIDVGDIDYIIERI
ncbi:MAG: hypothetical protein J5658_00540 [Prevotella sp.]|nr:hypothetical protein [Prevotella sp.]